VASRDKETIVLLYSDFMRSHLEYYIEARLGAPNTRKVWSCWSRLKRGP